MGYSRQENIEKGEKMMDELSDFFNSGNYEGQDAFVAKFQREHRTLQQNMFRAFFKIMVQSAETVETGRYDARNEGGVMACKTMVDAFKEKYGYLPSEGLPFI